jgi:pimeloyl-ACP methyl ester carboxylesterase
MPKIILKIQNMIFRLMPQSSFKKMGLPKKEVISFMNSMLDFDFGDKLKNISCFTLILCGAKDGVNKKAAKTMSELIPGAELRLVENANHEVNIDNPKELASIIEAFYHRSSQVSQ